MIEQLISLVLIFHHHQRRRSRGLIVVLFNYIIFFSVLLYFLLFLYFLYVLLESIRQTLLRPFHFPAFFLGIDFHWLSVFN